MTLSPSTGNPPAVTHEQIETWTRITDDVAAAMTMGGQQGMDLLLSLLPEWCEVADDVNSARQIVTDLADRGLRDEAIQWHAEGFFEAADRIDPDRPGWPDWAAAFNDRGVVTPRIDQELKEAVNRIHDDLALRDLSGQSLSELLTQLRRSTLVRGSMRDRLAILQSISTLDPSAPTWADMISPIRLKRANTLATEARASLANRDFEAITSLRDEVSSQDWGGVLPGQTEAFLNAAAACGTLAAKRSQLARTAATVLERVNVARGHQPGSAVSSASANSASTVRQQYRDERAALKDALREAQSVPEVAAIVVEMRAQDVLRQLDATLQEAFDWLDGQAQRERSRAQAAEIEAALLRVIESAPALTSNKDQFEYRLRKWRPLAVDTLEKGRRRAARLAGGTPAETTALLDLLADTRQTHEDHLRSLQQREKKIALYFVIGLAVAVVLVVGGISTAVMLG